MCVPLLIIFLTIAQAEEGVGDVEPLLVIAEEIGFGVVGGLVAGALGAWILRAFTARDWMSAPWQQIGLRGHGRARLRAGERTGGSGFLAAFAAGIVFGILARDRAEDATSFAEESGLLLNAITFLLFGAVLLGPALGALGWRIGV